VQVAEFDLILGTIGNVQRWIHLPLWKSL